jgi:hypothetical protein
MIAMLCHRIAIHECILTNSFRYVRVIRTDLQCQLVSCYIMCSSFQQSYFFFFNAFNKILKQVILWSFVQLG